MKFDSKYKTSIKKYIRKCHLQNCSHFVQASMCWPSAGVRAVTVSWTLPISDTWQVSIENKFVWLLWEPRASIRANIKHLRFIRTKYLMSALIKTFRAPLYQYFLHLVLIKSPLLIKRCISFNSMKAEWGIYASINYVIIGLDTGLLLVRRHAIIGTNKGSLLTGLSGTYLNQNATIFIPENKFENIVWNMTIISISASMSLNPCSRVHLI